MKETRTVHRKRHAAWLLAAGLGLSLRVGGEPVNTSGPAAVVNVTAHGAVPNDGKDDTRAVAAAVEQCRKTPGAVLTFPAGRYDFFADTPGTARPRRMAVHFGNLEGLVLDGQGSTLVLHGTLGALAFVNCRGVVVRNLTLDWDRPPFSTGTVVAAERTSFDVAVFPEFPVQGGEPVKAFMDYDPATSWPRKRCLDAYDAVTRTELVRPQVLRVHLARPMAAQVGTLMVLRHEVYGSNALNFRDCTDVRVEDVTIHTAPGMGLHASGTRDIALTRLRVIPPEGSRRILSTTADATHFNACLGTIQIRDCVFQGMGDDAVNVHGMFHTVTQVASTDTVVTEVRNKWLFPPLPGQRMEFTDPVTLLPYATGVVRSVTTDAAAGTHRIQFTGPLPETLRPGQPLGNVDWAPVLRISGCQVVGNRARGFLVQTRDAVIEKNLFRGCQASGINVTTDFDYWTESIGTRKIVIRDNTFEDLNNGADWHAGAISVFADAKGRKPGAPGVHRDIVIEGNAVRNTDGAGAFVGSADVVVVRGNTFLHCCRDPSKAPRAAAVYVTFSRNVRIVGNRLPADGRSARMQTPVIIGPGCDEKSIVVEGSDFDFPRRPGG